MLTGETVRCWSTGSGGVFREAIKGVAFCAKAPVAKTRKQAQAPKRRENSGEQLIVLYPTEKRRLLSCPSNIWISKKTENETNAETCEPGEEMLSLSRKGPQIWKGRGRIRRTCARLR